MNPIARGHLFVISGPSGVGKGTLRKALFRTVKDLEYSVSFTTRSPRRNEKEGIDYRFIDRDDFIKLTDEGKFLEWAEVHGNLYGTSREDVERILSSGKDMVLEIDVQGALQVKKTMPEAVLVFILPPSEAELEDRLSKRGTEKGEVLENRLKEARHEIELSEKYDHSVLNDDLQKALISLKYIIESYRT